MNGIFIKFTDQGLDYVFKVLAARPWQEVAPLMQDIQAQVASQQGANRQTVKTPVDIAQKTKAVEPALPESPGLSD